MICCLPYVIWGDERKKCIEKTKHGENKLATGGYPKQ